jgi:hypothetical protein
MSDPNNAAPNPKPAAPKKAKTWRAKEACTYLTGGAQRFVKAGDIVTADAKPNEHFEPVV